MSVLIRRTADQLFLKLPNEWVADRDSASDHRSTLEAVRQVNVLRLADVQFVLHFPECDTALTLNP